MPRINHDEPIVFWGTAINIKKGGWGSVVLWVFHVRRGGTEGHNCSSRLHFFLTGHVCPALSAAAKEKYN